MTMKIDFSNTVYTKIENYWGETILHPGEILCPICNGNGKAISDLSYTFAGRCEDCDGDGKVDWTTYLRLKNRT
jgi:DnaJ-class molecular chaperone